MGTKRRKHSIWSTQEKEHADFLKESADYQESVDQVSSGLETVKAETKDSAQGPAPGGTGAGRGRRGWRPSVSRRGGGRGPRRSGAADWGLAGHAWAGAAPPVGGAGTRRYVDSVDRGRTLALGRLHTGKGSIFAW